jgi:hypothetical protein
LLWVVIIGGGWVGKWVRGALKTRHARQMERLEYAERRELATQAANRPPEAVCGCTHHLAMHDKQGACHGTVEAAVEWDANRQPTRYEARRCECQRYVGPEPLPTLYAPDLADPS